ncbi:MAG TPA: hypothetical protein PLV68_04430, partial [Ilumatobacteraceae bacterium]|nr:hypothetical protein [Ilumatobacteraceae bacterium]
QKITFDYTPTVATHTAFREQFYVTTTGQSLLIDDVSITANVIELADAGAPTGSVDPSAKFVGGNVAIPVAALTGSGKTFSLWFKTTSTAGGVLLSKNNGAVGS